MDEIQLMYQGFLIQLYPMLDLGRQVYWIYVNGTRLYPIGSRAQAVRIACAFIDGILDSRVSDTVRAGMVMKDME